MSALEGPGYPHPVAPSRLRTTARIVAVVAAGLAIADGFRWGNRWYVSTMFGGAESGNLLAVERLVGAHDALVAGLAWLCLAIVAAVVGWRLRIVSVPDDRSVRTPRRPPRRPR